MRLCSWWFRWWRWWCYGCGLTTGGHDRYGAAIEHDLIVVSDEIYARLTWNEQRAPMRVSVPLEGVGGVTKKWSSSPPARVRTVSPTA